MKQLNSAHIRRTIVCLATAVVISLPAIAMAGVFDKAKSRTRTAVANAGQAVGAARGQRPLASAIRNTSSNLPDTELIAVVRELELMEQLQNTIELMREMNADYAYFSGGGGGCAARCAAFQSDLKDVFADLLWLVEEVPALSTRTDLIENIERISGLIDYMPPRALYLMWQALEGRMEELRGTAEEIRQVLPFLPPLEDVSDIAAYANSAGAAVADSAVCEWVEEHPFVELVQAKLERTAWVLKTVEGLVPDVEVKAEAGAEAGAAVANATAAAGAGVKPTDAIKIALKIAATVPEAINWAIKLNILRAKVICVSADRAST